MNAQLSQIDGRDVFLFSGGHLLLFNKGEGFFKPEAAEEITVAAHSGGGGHRGVTARQHLRLADK